MAAKETKSAKSERPKSSNRTTKRKAPNPAVKSSQAKTRPANTRPKPKRRVYSEKELGIPKLNMITPAGVMKPRGKKKGKLFVDDQESMMTILAMVNAEKEGEIESKIMKARHMEELREARRKEAEARQEEKRGKFEEAKNVIRKNRQKKQATANSAVGLNPAMKEVKPGSKRVSFG